jgi:serine/threonine-protein kinase
LALELPGYQFNQKIGEGGMATVYRGLQLSLQRPVAIKVLNSQMRDHGEVRSAFERESLIIARLSHPNIISVIDRGVSEKGTPFFIMEFIDGVDLSRIMREGSVPLARKLEVLLQIAKALAYAHKNGVIHRDIKPSNILVNSDWHAQVLDFGIAQFGQSESASDIVGTFAYMAPEIKKSVTSVSIQSDIYSFGVLMFEFLTGHLPDGSPTRPSTFVKALPAELDKLTLKCLAPDVSMRPQRVEQISDVLLDLLRGTHLDAGQAKRAQESLGKKSFSLLDIWRENQFGAVYLFAEKSSRNRFVIKKSLQLNAGAQVGKRLAGLEHANIVKLHGVSQNKKTFISVMDYMPGGSLEDRLIKSFTLDEFLSVGVQICRGLIFAHRNHVVHGNLRASNVLFDIEGNVRLSDFGWPSHYQVDESGHVLAAPEEKDRWYRLPDEPISEVGDIYAAGVLFYRMLISDLPRVKNGNLAQGQAFKRLPQELQNLLLSMLSQTPKDRPQHAAEILPVLDGLHDTMETRVWQPKPEEPKEIKVDQRKELLLFLLLILLFIVMTNTGLVILYDDWLELFN